MDIRAVLYFSALKFSFGWPVSGPLSPCAFFSLLNDLYSYMMPFDVIQVHTCVAALQSFDPAYLLYLPDGSNSSGIWGLTPAAWLSCNRLNGTDNTFGNLPPYSWGCFMFALSNGDPVAVIRYNACQQLLELASNNGTTQSTVPPVMPTLKPPFDWNTFQDPSISFWEEVVCVSRDKQDNLFLPNDNAKIVVAAQTYEQVLREMKHCGEI